MKKNSINRIQISLIWTIGTSISIFLYLISHSLNYGEGDILIGIIIPTLILATMTYKTFK